MALKHKRLRALIGKAGGEFHAVQFVPACAIAKNCSAAYYIVYFHSKTHGSTLTMKVRGLTTEKVSEHLKQSNIRFGF